LGSKLGLDFVTHSFTHWEWSFRIFHRRKNRSGLWLLISR